MKKTLAMLMMFVMVLASATIAFGTELTANDVTAATIEPTTTASDWYNQQTHSYVYPITQESPEWKEFNTHDEMLEACTIPNEILDTISTENLVKLVLDYPLLSDFRAFNTLQEGLDTLKYNFNGLRELLNRENGITELIKAYNTLPVENDSAVPIELTREVSKAEFTDESFTDVLEELKTKSPKRYERLYESIDNIDKLEFIEVLLSDSGQSLSRSEKSKFEKFNDAKQQEKNDSTLYNGEISQLAASITLKTPSGKVVPSSLYEVDRAEFSAAKISQINASTKSSYPKATFLRAASNVYNCHAYAWYKQSTPNRVWLYNCDTYRLDSKSYTSLGASTYKSSGDKVAYGNDHSGIVVTGNTVGASCVIKSKWGNMPLMQHNALYLPAAYDTRLTFYRAK